MNPPNGLTEIIKVFGDIHSYIGPDGDLLPSWRDDQLSIMSLPYPLALSWNISLKVTKMTCHRLLVPVFIDVFNKISAQNLQSKVSEFGGCFSFRQQRTGSKLSTHAWGIAIDLNPNTNEQGEQGDMDLIIVQLFRDAGFKWGGDWLGRARDPMHFQFCTGY